MPNRYPEAEPGRHRNRGGVSRAGGELAPALPDDLAVSIPSGGLGGWGCRPTLPLVCFAAPYPPNPLPRWGRGSPKDYFAGGFAPGTPALNRLRHLQTVPNRYPEAEPGRHRSRGGVSRAGGGLAPALPADLAIAVPSGGRGGWGCRPTLPLVCFPAPYPPSPLPRWGRGSPKDYFAGGFAPGTPALNRLRHLQTVPNRCPETEPGRHRSRGGVSRTSGGLAPALPDNLAIAVPSGGRRLGLPPCPAFSFDFAPIPPTPFPAGRGSPKDYFAGGFAPGTPALNRLRHLQTVPNRYPEAEPGRHRNRGGVSRAGGGLAPALPANPAVSIPNGGVRRLGLPPCPAFSFPSCPPSPDPLPRRGRGRL